MSKVTHFVQGVDQMTVLTVNPRLEDYEKAADFIEKWLKRSRRSNHIIRENMIVFEALFNDIILKGFSEDTEIKIEVGHTVGNPVIRIGFAGKRYVPICADDLEESIEYKIIKAYEDKLNYTYEASYNVIRLSVTRSYVSHIVLCAIGLLAALLVYALLSHSVQGAVGDQLVKNWVAPLETLFTAAMLMIGTPMTFFSILKNLLETHVMAQQSSNARKLQPKTVTTSIWATALAILFGLLIQRFLPQISGMFGDFAITGYTMKDLPQLISSLIPSDIFEPFRMISPYALILLSLLIIAAMRSAGSQFDRLKNAVDACYVLFSKMLSLVILLLPLFCFLAFLHLLLENGYSALTGVALCWVLVLLGIVLLLGSYALRLKIAGIPLGWFIKKSSPILRENIFINSAIDATPFNIRQCSRVFGIRRSALEEVMPVLSQTNLDGNCFIIIAITMLLIGSSGVILPWWNYPMLAVLVLFLSFGAPNQPGSILIGVLIIINFLKIPEMLPVAIYCEVLLGTAQNFVNVTGNIVMTVIENRESVSARIR